jgi:hypothetical protein
MLYLMCSYGIRVDCSCNANVFKDFLDSFCDFYILTFIWMIDIEDLIINYCIKRFAVLVINFTFYRKQLSIIANVTYGMIG